jgi:hypothetical protein
LKKEVIRQKITTGYKYLPTGSTVLPDEFLSHKCSVSLHGYAENEFALNGTPGKPAFSLVSLESHGCDQLPTLNDLTSDSIKIQQLFTKVYPKVSGLSRERNNNNNNKYSLRSNTKVYGGKTH